MLKLFLFSLLLFFSFTSSAEDMCQARWDNLKYIQKLMKIRSTDYLRHKEREARTAYQNCRRYKNNQNHARTYKKQSNNSQKKYYQKSYSYYGNKPVKPMIKDGGTLALNGRFKGEKQKAWIKYFKRPKECYKPDSTQKFAKCMKFENQRAAEFEDYWQKNKPPAPFKLGRG